MHNQSITSFSRLLVLPFCLAVAAAPLHADQFLDACLTVARQRDKKLAVAEEQINLAKVRVTRAARGYFPSVMVQRKFSRGSAIQKTDDSGQSLPNDYVEEYQAEELGLRLTQPIYEGGRQRASYRYDSLMEDAARYNYTKVKEDLYFRVKSAYYELLALKLEYNALKKAFDEIDALSKKVHVEYAAKAISELDLLEAENYKDKFKNLLQTAQDNLGLAEKKLLVYVNVDSLDAIPAAMPVELSEDVPEITFTLDDCKGFIRTNNLEVRSSQAQILQAEQKKIISRSKVIPKLYIDGYYGQSGEAFVTQPLDLASVWSVMARVSWSLWGSSLEVSNTQEKTEPKDIVDVSTRVDSKSTEIKFALFDDLSYFVESKEGKVNYQQSLADYDDIINKAMLDVEKSYNQYIDSLRNARTLKQEIAVKKRRLDLLRKQNSLYEVQTVAVMEQSWKYAETISAFGKAIATNYASVADLERLTLMTLR